MKQQKLTFFMPKNTVPTASSPEQPPITANESAAATGSGETSSPPTSTVQEPVSSSNKKPTNQSGRTYRPKWEQNYPWLQYDTSKNVMTCKICTDRGRKNAFTRGSSNFKTSNMEDHQKSNDHQTAMIAPFSYVTEGQYVSSHWLESEICNEPVIHIKNKVSFWRLCSSYSILANFQRYLSSA